MKTKTLLLLPLLGVLAFGAFFFNKNSASNASAISKLTPQERIARAESTKNELSKDQNAESFVLISFDNRKTSNETRNLLKNKNLRLEQIYHVSRNGSNTFSGGYIFEEGESLDSAISKHENTLKEATQLRVNSLRETIAERERLLPVGNDEKSIAERQSLDAMKVLLADSELRLNELGESGVKFYGIQVKGKNAEILNLLNTPGVKIGEIISRDEDAKALPLLP